MSLIAYKSIRTMVIIKWYKKNNNKYASKRHAEVYDSRILDWQVCPYCKRKIKIKEGK